MSSKEGACYRALFKYGFMIDGPESSLENVSLWPEPKPKETFKQWKTRVFGKSVRVKVYTPYEPESNTHMATLARDSGGEHLKNIFGKYGESKDRKLEIAIDTTEQKTVERFSTFPKETLALLLDEFESELQPSVEEFFKRYLTSTTENINTESLLTDLIKTYNDAVIQFRRKDLSTP